MKFNWNNLEKEDLQTELVFNDTIESILNNFGLKNVGGNYKTLLKYVIKLDLLYEYNLLLSRSFKQRTLKARVLNNSIKPISFYLTKNSTIKSNSLKKRLLNNNIFTNKCSICGLSNVWNNKNLVLQLDHINGVSNDNRIENLRLLCPNCHSQTNTFCGMNNINIIKDNKYCSCGNIIKTKSKELCKSCVNINKRKVKRPNKDILLTDITLLGYRGTGKKYGVSDNSIKKWIK
jgi:hypothetical protein